MLGSAYMILKKQRTILSRQLEGVKPSSNDSVKSGEKTVRTFLPEKKMDSRKNNKKKDKKIINICIIVHFEISTLQPRKYLKEN